MTKKCSTKRALIASVLVLALCFTSLIGTTFAWFTDSVTSSGNKIVSGSLKIDLEIMDKDTGAWSSIKTSQDPIFDYENWEPGYVDAKMLKVDNEGTLALKWKAKFISDTELGILADVIDVYVLPYGILTAEDAATKVAYPDRDLEGYTKVGTLREFVNTIEETTYGTLESLESAYLGIALKMQESAGNDYQEETLGAFDIQIVAAQLAYEGDSFGTDYDAGAEYPEEVTNADGLKAALAAGGEIVITESFKVDEPITVEEGVEAKINLDGNNIELEAPITNNGELVINGGEIAASLWSLRASAANEISAPAGYAIENNGKLTVNGGTFTGLGCIRSKGGKVTINGGNFYASSRWQDAVYQHTLKAVDTVVTINGGNFDATVNGQTNAMLNVSENAVVTINGGNFVNVAGELTTFDPYLFTYEKNGKLIINDGEFYGGWRFNGETNTTDIYGGNFTVSYDGQSFHAASTHKLTVYGGTFTGKLATQVPGNLKDGFAAVANQDGSLTVLPELENGSSPKSVAGYPGLYTDGTNYYVYTAEGLASANALLCTTEGRYTLGFNRTYNIMADIDATDVIWNSAWLEGSHGTEKGLVLDGNGHTISNLTINGSMFSGASYGATIQDLTFDKVTAESAGYHVAVVWGATYGDITFNNVVVKNSSVSGLCNVSAFVGATEPGVKITYNNCVVENTTLASTGVAGSCDPTGANVFMGRALNNAQLVFSNCSSIGNTVENKGELAGGGIYGYTTWTGKSFALTGTSYDFENFTGPSVEYVADGLYKDINDGAYLIDSAAGLTTFAAMVNGGTLSNVTAKLMSNIDLEEEDWTPIGTSAKPFLGTFDGQGYEISNLLSVTNGDAGLFGQLATQIEGTNGIVKNLTVKNATIIASNQGSAGIIAVARLGALVENVKLTGTVTIQGYRGVGGIVGNGFPRVNNCTVEAEGTIHATYWGVGGIIGFASDKGARANNSTIKGVGEGLTISAASGGVGAVTGTPHGAATNGAYVSNVTLSSNSNYVMAYVDASGSAVDAIVENVVIYVNDQEIEGCDKASVTIR